MTSELILYLLISGLAGGFINGLAGFGTALFSLSFLLNVLSPLQAVGIVLVMSVFSGVQGLWVVRKQLAEHKTRLARFLLPALPAIPLGVYSLHFIDAVHLKIGIGFFMLFYGGFFAFRASLPNFNRPLPFVDCVIGFIGGALGGAAGLSGAIPTIWLSMRPYSKMETRAVLQPYNVTILSLTIIALMATEAFNSQSLLQLAIILPAALVASVLGIRLFTILNTDQFRRLLIILMAVSGLIVLTRSLFDVWPG